ncbi:restriction endonuclease subunit S [Micromonospora parva]|uniref:restriction endonuclease subunit S n=1 Tax=Micromonospora parva TaxID=1464048 RepID=UPI003710E8E7
MITTALSGPLQAGWRMGRIKDLVGSAANGVWGDEPLDDGHDVHCVRAADFDRDSLTVRPDKLPLRRMDFRAFRKHRLRAGDLVWEKSGGGETQPVGLAVKFDLTAPAVCSNFCTKITPSAGTDSRYLAYVFAAAYAVGLNQRSIKQTTGLQNLDGKAFLAEAWPIPDLAQQRRIADFLDVELSRIKDIEGRRQRQLAVLDERWLSEVSECLVPGILSQPSARPPMRWLPELPSHIPLVRLGYVCHLQTGLTVDGARDLSGDVVTRPYLRVANVQAGYIRLESVTEITVPRAIADRSTLREGDVLMTEGGDLDKLGRGAIWRGELEGCLHQNHIFALRPDRKQLDGEYLALVTQSLHGRCYFESTGVKTTNLASTNSSKILGFPVPLPSLNRQREKVRVLRRSLDSIERVRRLIEQQVMRLRERRQALITAAVTGQVDVTTARVDV